MSCLVCVKPFHYFVSCHMGPGGKVMTSWENKSAPEQFPLIAVFRCVSLPMYTDAGTQIFEKTEPFVILNNIFFGLRIGLFY